MFSLLFNHENVKQLMLNNNIRMYRKKIMPTIFLLFIKNYKDFFLIHNFFVAHNNFLNKCPYLA